jgi:hypothetical protein
MKSQDVKSHARTKREGMQQDGQWAKRKTEPEPVDGQPLPDPAEGWVPDSPKQDATLTLAAVKSIRMSDGTTRKFYLMAVPVSEVREMKKRAKRVARQIKRDNEAAAKKSAKRAARAVLFALGKQF